MATTMNQSQRTRTMKLLGSSVSVRKKSRNAIRDSTWNAGVSNST
jgi:hypothetical protein